MASGFFDLAIVGGGPVGLATAIAAREAAMKVALLEPHRPPVDKACGEGLMPPGVRWLGAHGVSLGKESGRPFVGTRYVDGDLVAEGRFREGHGLGIRRDLLHDALRRRAEQLGAELRWGQRARGLGSRRVLTDRGDLHARWIVGSDGLHSSVRRWAGLQRPGDRPRFPRFGLRRRYSMTPWTDLVEVHVGRDAEAYVTPLGAEEISVAILSRQPRIGFDRWLKQFPTLQRRLAAASPSSSDRGAGPFGHRAGGVLRDRVALVGDATGFVDALTGEGLASGFLQASALVWALSRDAPEDYVRAHSALSRAPARFTRGVLFLSEHRHLRRAILRFLARSPALFDRLLGWPLQRMERAARFGG